MKYSEIVKICEENRIQYDKGIKKIDDCSFPNDVCYDLSKKVLESLENALHIGFKTDFKDVGKNVKELTEIAVALTATRAERSVPIYTKAIKNINNDLLTKATKIKEESVMKNTIKQYVDTALKAIKYLQNNKYEEGAEIQPLLKESEQIYKEIDSLMLRAFDEKSEEAVQLGHNICNAMKEWRDAAATGMLNENAVNSLLTAKAETKKWAQLYAKQKAAKTPAPIYVEDTISSFANIGNHLADYELFKMNLRTANKGIEAKIEKVNKLKEDVSEMEREVVKLEKEKEKLALKKKELKRDLKNGDITEDQAYNKAIAIKERLEELEDELYDWDERIAGKKDLIEISTDDRVRLIEEFNDVVLKAELYKDEEEVFVEISKQMNFPTMIKVLNGTASSAERQQVSDTYSNIDFIIKIAKENAQKMIEELKDERRRNREARKEEEKSRNRSQNRRTEEENKKKVLADLLGDDEDEDEVEEERPKTRERERYSNDDDLF